MFTNPSNLNQEPEDIFSTTDAALPDSANASVVSKSPDNVRPASGRRGLKVLVIILVIAVIIGVGYFVFGQNLVKLKDRLVAFIHQSQSQANNNLAPINPENNNQIATPSSAPDSDHDGLTDQEEESLKTDPNKVDTDGDGLFDGEEVKIYKTNPINLDTDGDGISDGDEVKKGTDPNNPTPGALLFDLQKEISNFK